MDLNKRKIKLVILDGIEVDMKINQLKQAESNLNEILYSLNKQLAVMADCGFDCNIDIHERSVLGCRQTIRFIKIKPLIDISSLED